MGLTREQAIAEHRKMWNWIADERKKGSMVNKVDYLQSHGFDRYEMLSDCFLCTYTMKVCFECPLKWKNGLCFINGSEYERFCDDDVRNSHIWARKIANLPERG